MGKRLTGKRWRRQVVEFGEKAAFLPVAARREGRMAGDAERMMDGIFVGHHERTGASLFLSERGLLRGTRVQRKTADQQWDNEFIRKCRAVPWVRPPPVPAIMMPIPEAIVRTPQQRRRYILKQDVARYGPIYIFLFRYFCERFCICKCFCICICICIGNMLFSTYSQT